MTPLRILIKRLAAHLAGGKPQTMKPLYGRPGVGAVVPLAAPVRRPRACFLRKNP